MLGRKKSFKIKRNFGEDGNGCRGKKEDIQFLKRDGQNEKKFAAPIGVDEGSQGHVKKKEINDNTYHRRGGGVVCSPKRITGFQEPDEVTVPGETASQVEEYYGPEAGRIMARAEFGSRREKEPLLEEDGAGPQK